jgi:hypothetical protein
MKNVETTSASAKLSFTDVTLRLCLIWRWRCVLTPYSPASWRTRTSCFDLHLLPFCVNARCERGT